MNFNVSFNFEGGQTFEMLVPQADLKRFLTSVNKNEVFWDQKGGTWLAFNKVLYFKVSENKDAPVEDPTNPNQPTNPVE